MRRVTEHRRSAPGFAVCARCLEVTDNADLREVARPGASKGIWVCRRCAAEMTGADDA